MSECELDDHPCRSHGAPDLSDNVDAQRISPHVFSRPLTVGR
jgi:hypothetical protein